MADQKGFSLVELLIVVIIISIIAAIAIPSLLASRRAANEANAIQSLRTIHSAQITYYATNRYVYGTLTNLSGAKMLDSTFTGASLVKSEYTIAESIVVGGTGYCADANPTAVNGTRTFGLDENGVVYGGSSAGNLPVCTTGVLTVNGTAAPIQ